MRPIFVLPFAAFFVGCMTGVAPLQRVSDASNETNLASRFGQVEVALSHVDSSMRTDFSTRRAQWGQSIRVLESDTVGITLVDETHATVTIEVSWVSLSDNLLRSTKLQQEWENKKAGWLLMRERRLSGESGLFGETLTQLEPPHPDVHRPSRTLGN
jgi:PBP1b-binding outer membrane lipoprotein LpoB